jgi:predicted phage terminase large subunit-like protein
VTAGDITRLVINLPPRYMKSLLVSVLWPTWEWLRFPTRRWIFASYAETLSSKHSLDRRAVIRSPPYQARWGDIVQLAIDQNVKHEFQNTRRGVMIATSFGGSITGKGGDRIVVDDPHNPAQVESDVQREAVLTFFTRNLCTRLDSNKSGAIVVVSQRVHEQDLSARCLDLGYTALVLPVDPETPQTIVFPRSGRTITRQVGDLLWPEREGRPELEAQKRALGQTDFAAHYQQQPVPSGGTIFQRACFQNYDELPAGVDYLISWDMSFKNSRESDFVVGLVLARQGGDIYVVDRVKGQWDFSQTCHQFERLSSRYPQGIPTLVEEAANGHAIINVLTRSIPGIIGIVPHGSKLGRARAAQPIVESRNVFLPNPSPRGVADPSRAWVPDFLHQLAIFPKAVHDDDVDAFSQGVAYFMSHLHVRPASAVQNPKPEATQPFDRLTAVVARMRHRRGAFTVGGEEAEEDDEALAPL